MHEQGYIIGDINAQGILAANDATVRLIDCDSFQFHDGRCLHRCEVAVAAFTPPELHGVELADVIRTPDHDVFGLAVLIFHLLFLGRHPFAGRYVGAEDMPIERAIREYRFAYDDASNTGMRPPPNMLQLRSFPDLVAELFRRAFGVGGQRPDGQAWLLALSSLRRSLVRCPSHPAHVYPPAATTCPWCRLETSTGVLLFPLTPVFVASQGGFELHALWQRVEAIIPPVLAPPCAIGPSCQPGPIARVAGDRYRAHRTWMRAAAGPLGLAFAVLTFVFPQYWWLIGALSIGAIRAAKGKLETLKAGFVRSADGARDVYEKTLNDYEAARRGGALVSRFVAQKRELEHRRLLWLQLPAKLRKKRAKLEQHQRHRQLQEFLEGFEVRGAKLAGLGSSRIATLGIFGIETAADVTSANISRVPGIGLVLTPALVEWRRGLERSFRFDPSAPSTLKGYGATRGRSRKRRKR